ncbi:MAG TPA: tetratricopeptide repeat protein [Chthonomonadales bacterium]|nr:tetratricopeptide repeat protein [Chthonomonadales bacterium]
MNAGRAHRLSGDLSVMSPIKSSTLLRISLLAAAVVAGVWGVAHNPTLRQRRLAAMSLRRLQQEVRSNPQDGDALYYFGIKQMAGMDFAAAAQTLKQAAIDEPGELRIREAWMRALLTLGRTPDAYEELKQYVESFPNDGAGHRLLGQFLVDRQSMQAARTELTQAVRIQPKDRAAWAYLAAARDNLADRQGAIVAEQRAISLNPNIAGDHLYLGSLLERGGQAAQAKSELEAAIRLNPHLAAAHRELASWYLRDGSGALDFSSALSEAQTAATQDGADAGAQIVLGDVLLRLGRPQQALAPYRKAAQISADDPAPARRLEELCRRLGDSAHASQWHRDYLKRQGYATAVRALFEAIEKQPERTDTHNALADLYARHGNAQGTIEQCAAAMHSSPQAPQVMAAAAGKLAAGGFRSLASELSRGPAGAAPNSAGAAAAFEKAQALEATAIGPKHITPQVEKLAAQAVDLDPNNPVYLGYLLHLQVARRYNDKAIASARRLIAVAPGDADAHYLLAIVLLDRAGTPAALQEVENELRAAPPASAAEEATLHFGLGLLALKRNQGALAVTELQQAQKLDPSADVTYYKLAFAENAAGDRAKGAAYMQQYKARIAFKQKESDLLEDIAMHPNKRSCYESAIAFLQSHGLQGQAEAVRVAERRMQRPGGHA